MVAQQILVLFVQVRVLVSQQIQVFMKSFVAIIAAIFVLLGCNNSTRNGSAPYQTNVFPFVKIPAIIASDNKLAAEYVAEHYWDNFLSVDRLLRLSPAADTVILGVSRKIFQESFYGYIAALEAVEDSLAKACMKKVVSEGVKMAEDGYSPFFGEFVQCAEKTLFDAHSPMMNDELYLPILEGIQRCSAIPSRVKESYRYQLEICNKNRVGSIAADFVYVTNRGPANMHSIKSEYLLIFFNEPDCSNCLQALEQMKNSEVILNFVGMGVLKVLAVSPSDKSILWSEKRADYPADWIYAYSKGGELNNGTIYTIRASPSLYLLDTEKRVIVKDASVGRIQKALAAIKDAWQAKT